MIREFLNAEKQLAISSDLWHVVHAEWTPGSGPPRFLRTIVSEHKDKASALRSARALKAELVDKMKVREKEARDQILVKRPSSESLRNGERLVRPHQ